MRLADAVALRVGDEEVAAVYVGAEQVWTGEPPPVLQSADWYVDARDYAGTGALLDQGPHGLHARLGSSTDPDTNDPLFLKPDPQPFVYLPGTTANYLSAPDSAALDLTTELDIRCKVAMTDWTPSVDQGLVLKWGGRRGTLLCVQPYLFGAP